MFSTESEMSKQFEKYLKSNFGNSFLKEHEGLFGVPDFVFYAKTLHNILIVSFELKLKDWKRAAKQAFRYKSFSNTAFVVMESSGAISAINNIELFRKYNIGLAIFDISTGFQIIFQPSFDEPYSSKLNQKLIETLSSSRKKAKNYEVLFKTNECIEA
jgi:hypothetical protein